MKKHRMGVPREYEPVLPKKVKAYIAKKHAEASETSQAETIPTIMVLNFVTPTPKSVQQIHQQVQTEIDPSTTREEIQTKLTSLVEDNHILSADKPDGTAIYWRG